MAMMTFIGASLLVMNHLLPLVLLIRCLLLHRNGRGRRTIPIYFLSLPFPLSLPFNCRSLLMSSENLSQTVKRVLLTPPNKGISSSSINFNSISCFLQPFLHSRIVDQQRKDFGMVPEVHRL